MIYEVLWQVGKSLPIKRIILNCDAKIDIRYESFNYISYFCGSAYVRVLVIIFSGRPANSINFSSWQMPRGWGPFLFLLHYSKLTKTEWDPLQNSLEFGDQEIWAVEEKETRAVRVWEFLWSALMRWVNEEHWNEIEYWKWIYIFEGKLLFTAFSLLFV